MKEIILLYGLDPKKQTEMIKVARIAGAAVKTVETKDLSQSVAHLAGVMGAVASPKEYEGEPKRECVVLCGLTSKRFHAVIDGMRKHKVFVDLRGVMTQQNMTWPLEKMIDEMSEEKAYMTAWNKLDKLLKAQKEPPAWAAELLKNEDATTDELNDAIQKIEAAL